MNTKTREIKRKILDEKILECSAKYQTLLEKIFARHTAEISDLKIKENLEMNNIKTTFAVPTIVTHSIYRGDLQSLKEAIKKKWVITSSKKNVSERIEIADIDGCINPVVLKKPFSFEYITLEEEMI